MTQSEHWQTVRCPHCGAYIGQCCTFNGLLYDSGLIISLVEGQCATCLQLFDWSAVEAVQKTAKSGRRKREDAARAG